MQKAASRRTALKSAIASAAALAAGNTQAIPEISPALLTAISRFEMARHAARVALIEYEYALSALDKKDLRPGVVIAAATHKRPELRAHTEEDVLEIFRQHLELFGGDALASLKRHIAGLVHELARQDSQWHKEIEASGLDELAVRYERASDRADSALNSLMNFKASSLAEQNIKIAAVLDELSDRMGAFDATERRELLGKLTR